MSLGNMGDIAGCRIIVYSDQALRNLVKTINQRFDVKENFNDYTQKPKDDGYRGYHLYVVSPINKNKLIEIQLRTIATHKWASLVEIIDIVFNLKLKEGQKHAELQEFLLLQSLPKANLTLEKKKRIIELDGIHKIYSLLNEVFIKNHISIRKAWLELSKKHDNCYFIIEVDQDKKSDIESIKDYVDAELRYFDMFLSNRISNFVLTYIEKPTFKRLCIAYASYMMVKHDYLTDWNVYAREILNSDSKKRDIRGNLLYKNYVERNISDQDKLLNDEFKEVEEQINTAQNGQPLAPGIEEWVKELNQRIEELRLFSTEISEIQKNRPFTIWEKIFGRKE